MDGKYLFVLKALEILNINKICEKIHKTQTLSLIFLNLFTRLPGTGVLGMLERFIANSLAMRS